MKLPKDLEARCLALAGQAPAPAPAAKGKAPEMVAPAFYPPGIWVVPALTASESNDRNWKDRSRRSHAVRLAVSRTLGPHLRALAEFAEHYHAFGVLKVYLVRLGGRKLDPSNLPAALKATEDAIALLLGASDGDPRWQADWRQEPGGPAGVRIELAKGTKQED